MPRPQVSVVKRQREQAKRERQARKAEKRAQRKNEKSAGDDASLDSGSPPAGVSPE